MRNRTKKFSLDILELLEILPNSKTFKLIENQLGRAALSVDANYRVVSRAKSRNDFINKLKIVEEECDECTFFLEILSAPAFKRLSTSEISEIPPPTVNGILISSAIFSTN